jgi:Ca2+-binding RTX toxin-like protein
MNRSALVVGTVTAFLSFPGIASAGTVTVVGSNPFATFQAAAGEVNDLRVEQSGPMRITDAGATLVAKKGCYSLSTGEITCDVFPPSIDARLGDQNDKASVTLNKSRVWGGAGDDTISADSFSGSGEAYGESGNDTLFAGGHGGQIADGGSGDDTINGGGWEGNATAIGGTGNDVIRFQFGYYGQGDMQGGTGDDIITSTANGYASTADGGTGDDIIVIDGPNRGTAPYTPSDNRFTITAGDGNDSVVAGPQNDTIQAGAGRDFVDVKDGGSDTVSCGDGIDVVRADDTDTIAADCEVRTT